MRQRKKMRGRKLIIILTSLSLSTTYFLSAFSARLNQTILDIAKAETTNLTTYVINKAIKEEAIENGSYLSAQTSANGKVASLSFNTNLINLTMSNITKNIQKELAKINAGDFDSATLYEYGSNSEEKALSKGIIYQIPLGLIFKNNFLSEIGPRLPVRFKVIGDITNNVKSHVTNYGINNVLIEVVSQIKIRSLVIIPYTKDQTLIEASIPLAMEVIQGEVPLYYQGSYDVNGGGLSIPLQ